MPSPLGEGQTDMPKNRDYQGEVLPSRPSPFFIDKEYKASVQFGCNENH